MLNRKTIGKLDCCFSKEASSEVLLLQPVGPQELGTLEEEVPRIREAAQAPFDFCAFAVSDWNTALSPWAAPAAFGDEPFAGGAEETLRRLTEALPALAAQRRVILGGYSLAGLFSLWAASRTDAFRAVAAASPSVWFPGWAAYAEAHPIRAEAVYLSLGDREERTRNPVMAAVGPNVRALDACLEASPFCRAHTLEWNRGGHFSDPLGRTVRAFCWALAHCGAAKSE